MPKQTDVTHDITQPANLLTHSQGTGPIRTRKPIYQDTPPPCNHACPAGENIQAWLSHVQAGEYEKAWTVLVRDNPFPAIHGRVCYHPCETSCNRAPVDSAVSIHAIERFLGDLAIKNKWSFKFEEPPTQQKVLIVGAGPSGLSCAYHLARRGHQVVIKEAGPVAGGMMHFGIPAYRLPRRELMDEIKRIEEMGVQIHLNSKVDDLIKEKETGVFDAAFVAIGAHLSKKVSIPAREAGKILDAVSFLKQAALGEAPKLGRRVAIYGGGNTAMDAARTARRLGADEALIIYRRDREHMPAHEFEADEALAEGVKINWLRTIKEMSEGKITIEVMKINQEGVPEPTGQYETLEADALILALGQDTDTGFLKNIPGVEFSKDGTIIVDRNMMTGAEGIFAGGDMVPSERTVTIAVGHGKKAAAAIHRFLIHKKQGRVAENAPAVKEKITKPTLKFEQLHRWYSTNSERREQGEVSQEERLSGFQEVVLGFKENEARYEAGRCFSCGNCFECDGCFGACPERAIIKLGKGKRYQFDYAKCTGCAVCYEQCPCHAIEIIEEGK